MAQSTIGQVKATSLDWLEKTNAHFSKVSRDIWEFAELGLYEFKSSDLLVSQLKSNGFTVERGQAHMPIAFVGTYSYGSGKPVIGIMAEYDALPGLDPEETGKPGHGCGHNLYGTGAVAAAIAVKEAMAKHHIDGTIKLFGTPSEDTHGGKMWMAREHVFDGCDAILSWHPMDQNKTGWGGMLANQLLEIDFHGISAHAGTVPEKGRSALDALQIFTIACEFLREHMIEPMRIHYIFTAAGEAPNSVPALARCRMAVRGPSMIEVEQLRSRDGGIDDCARAGALATGTQVEIKIRGAFWEDIVNRTGAYLLYDNMKAIGAPRFTDEEKAFAKSKGYDFIDETIYEPDDIKTKASHDTGEVSWVTPLISVRAACAPKGTPGHSFDSATFYGMSIGQKGMMFAAKIQAATSLDLMMDAEKLKAVTTEWKERVASLPPYHVVPLADAWPPIPKENPPDFQGPPPPA